MPPPVSERGPAPRSELIAELAAHPDGLRWARDCAWVPGTGHCRNRACSGECLLRPQREAETELAARQRRKRRRARGPAVERAARAMPVLVLLAQFGLGYC